MKEIINGYIQNYQEFPLSVGSLAETNILRMTTVYSVGVRLSGNKQFIRFFGSEAYGVYFIAGLIYLALKKDMRFTLGWRWDNGRDCNPPRCINPPCHHHRVRHH